MPSKIETGRFVNLALEDILCEVYNLNEIEDELHFICKCELYYEIRNEFYDSKLSFNPNFPGLSFQDNFTYLMNNWKPVDLYFNAAIKLGETCYTMA